MKRIADTYLLDWKKSLHKKPLLLRGARQIGKTYAARTLGETFDNFVEINFELQPNIKKIFKKDLEPLRIIRDISLITGQKITPVKTLLFFDEIQECPEALRALRYLYEKIPEQHVIAAGSLLDFTIETIGIPVGRVSSLYMYPLSFFEFLCATKQKSLAKTILENQITNPLSEIVHEKALSLLGEYIAIGGMPEAISRWIETQDPQLCFQVHNALVDTYRQDFSKYGSKFQTKYLDILFNAIPYQLGTKFKYSSVEGEFRKRELTPCLDLLITAGIIHPIMRSAGNGIPIGAEADPKNFKTIFLDVALSQTILGFNVESWFLNPKEEFINKGMLTESLVGQELLAYSSPSQKTHLFYWGRNVFGSEAEVDYIIEQNNHIIPIEVKGGYGSTLRSMRMFLKKHPNTPYGLRFSTHNYSVHENIHSYPLYAIAHVIQNGQSQNKKAYENLLT